ncbi:helix-turn-helix domain-containing protein [Staphylococcus chromogenes]|uniref:helix-turn-helix domain-containing protein n=1 Tax=Staphylococcus chromogenes TaxID=46126 RepID=UPI00288674AB|nr:helix-turn-helix transcriptional regulator [Staphylococcus chromogenes]MDT0656337.1 helix-turn-helix transcriptional regulator [Staphylococcus chromogenes]MDT0672759.1 helix-turn-helix transcriptional regulator [Staphylococcus chromogenes]MDT0674925.1 helix-turn-helix transcriptional regulator [Staphylococcus chromogenes]MDT0699129.1 helix-turn-helix transcriptional regulator [Staphylococcus chromogenes]
MNLPSRLKELRKNNKMTQEEVAEKIHISRQTLSNWETGKNYPDLQNLLYLCELYNITLYELVEDDIELIKNKITKSNIYITAGLFLFGMVMLFLSIIIIIKFNVFIALIISSIAILTITITSVTMERVKKENKLNTFSKILRFIRDCE